MAFIGNTHTNEFHDLSNPNGNCQLGEIKHRVSLSSIDDALAKGWDPCDWCLPQVMAAKIIAKPGSNFERAVSVTLDGSKSRPRRGAFKVTSWQWTITPADGQGGVVVTSDEKKLTFVALGDFTAELTVKNDKPESKTRSRDFTCDPRTLKSVRWAAVIQGVSHGRLLPGDLEFGKNICAIEITAESSDHVIHRVAPNATWQDEGYTRKQVEEGDPGPWHDCWYVDETNLFIQRGELTSVDYLSSSSTSQANATGGHQADFASLAASSKAHEHFHSAIFRDGLKGRGQEPVKIIETLVADNEDDVIKAADAAIITLESDLQGDPAANEATVHQMMQAAWGGKGVSILLPDGSGGFELDALPDLSALGD